MTANHPDRLVLLDHSQIERHPRNMRRHYPLADVRKMGLSQAERARRGELPCVQPLVVTVGAGVAYDPARHMRFVCVAGHLRHAGNAWLKARAPKLNCLVRYYSDEADMLADMGAENGVRADPGLLGWAHYVQDRLDAGVKLHQVMREAGLSLGRVEALRALVSLSPAAQALIDDKRLPLGAAALLARVSEIADQAEIAERLAHRQASLSQIEMAVRAWQKQHGQSTTRGAYHRRPSPIAAEAPAPLRPVRPDAPALVGAPELLNAALADVRLGARAACNACDYGQALKDNEPAWHIALNAAGQTCRACDLREFEAICDACPLAAAMKKIVIAAQLSPASRAAAKPAPNGRAS